VHAVVGRSTLHDVEQARSFLNQSLPRIRQAPGFISGHWVMLSDNSGTSMLLFESEEAAQAAVAQLRANPPPSDAITFDSIEIGEVVAEA
jgi:hypothetical protein